MKYTNESQSTLVVGRKNYKPGEELPAPENQTEKYQRNFQKFLDLGLIKQPKTSTKKAKTTTSTKKKEEVETPPTKTEETTDGVTNAPTFG